MGRFIKYLEKQAIKDHNELIDSSPDVVNAYMLSAIRAHQHRRGLLSATVDEPIGTDSATLGALSRRVPSTRAVSRLEPISGGILGGYGGGLLGTLAGVPFGKPSALVAGALAGAGVGGYAGYRYGKNRAEIYSKLDKKTKKKLLKAHVAKHNKEKDSAINQAGLAIDKGHTLGNIGGLLSMVTTPAVGASMVFGAGQQAPLQDEHLSKMIEEAGLRDKLVVRKPKIDKLPFFEENAYFAPYEKRPADGRVGEITSLSKRLWKPGVMAHEIGHANIEANKGLVNLLQSHAYGPTLLANRLGLGVIPATAAVMATNDEDNTLKGAAKGGLVGALANIGVLAPEFEATRRGIKYMSKTNLPMSRKIMNSATLAPAFLTYLMTLAGPSAVAGALHARSNKRKKDATSKKSKMEKFFRL
jgi:hypothetical protein